MRGSIVGFAAAGVFTLLLQIRTASLAVEGIVNTFHADSVRVTSDHGAGVVIVSNGGNIALGIFAGECSSAGVTVGSAGIAIGSRRGLGKVKHIDTAFLWVQDLVTNQRMRLNKVGTKEMLADFLTKGVNQEVMRTCMTGLNLYFKSGASKLAFKA